MEQTIRLGGALGQSVGTIALVLSNCWTDTRYRQQRAEGIFDQEVDKASLLLLNVLREADPAAQYFRPSPFTIWPGRYGPGPALVGSDGKPQFICDFIESIQQRFPEVKLFQISSASGTPRYFEPLITQVAWDQWKSRKPSLVVDLIERTREILIRLSQKQVIAFGRHPSIKDSRESMNFLHRTFRSSLTSLLDAHAGRDGEVTDEIRWILGDLCSIASSGHAKATEDCHNYSNARKVVLDADDTVARRAFLECRVAWEEIARDPQWRKLSPRSRSLYHLANAVEAGFEIADSAARDGNRVGPLERLEAAQVGWSSEGASAGLNLPVGELSKGDLRTSKPRLIACVDGVMRSEYLDP